MSNSLSFSAVFADYRERVSQLRREDTDFDEACRDFELLIDELAASSSEESHVSRAQLRDSLGGLAEEIAEKLAVDPSTFVARIGGD